MSRRGFVVVGALFVVIACQSAAIGQESSGRRTLADRLNSLRRGFGGRAKTTERQTASREVGPTPAEAELPQNRTRNRYPSVDSRDLLPRDVAGTRSPGGTSPRTASRPRMGSVPARTLGDAYLDAPLDEPAPLPDDEPAQEYTPLGTAPRPNSSLRSTQSADRSRSTRRSPNTDRQYDFDAAELRRDLVDWTGRPVSERDAPEESTPAADKVVAESKLPEDGEPYATTLADSAPALTENEPALVDNADSPRPVDEPIAKSSRKPSNQPQQLASIPEEYSANVELNEPQLTSQLPTEPEIAGPVEISPTEVVESPFSRPAVSDGTDQQRVQQAGEQAFAGRVSDPTSSTSTEVASPTPTTAAVGPLSERLQGNLGGERGPFSTAGTLRESADNILASNQMPMISSHVSGPKQILIGREATYQLQLTNNSRMPAHEVIAQVNVPSWAEVVDTVASNGIIQRSQDASQPNTFRWQLHRLAADSSETLDVKLVPRSSRPLELGINWTYAPVGSRAVVEVQEPKLRMHVSGPDEVLFGKPQLYRLTLTNPGTGVAEDVKIDLMPPGGGQDAVSSHVLGELRPGTNKSVEVELTAREAGKLAVKATATAAGGITADASKSIFCRKPELEVDWRGPEQKYAGTVATYYFRVRNPGTASADDVAVNVHLPEGAELVSASEGQMYDSTRRAISWRVGSLRPGDDYYMELKCQVNSAGTNAFRIGATTALGDLTDQKVAETNVIALADLKLDVTDPKGPVPVGDEAVYEIRVRNRGTNTAEAVNIVALFSDGIDAEAVEGAQYSVSDGRVTFRTIEKLPAGREVLLKIRARANMPGTHIFRAEVLCRDLEIKLAAEETTRFFQDDSPRIGAGEPQQSAGRVNAFNETETGGRY